MGEGDRNKGSPYPVAYNSLVGASLYSTSLPVKEHYSIFVFATFLTKTINYEKIYCLYRYALPPHLLQWGSTA